MCLFTKNIAVLEAQISSLKKEEVGPPLEEKEENSDWIKVEEEYRGNRGGVRGLKLSIGWRTILKASPGSLPSDLGTYPNRRGGMSPKF